MPYANTVSRSNVSALIPEEATREIIQNVEDSSAALSLFRHVTMSTNQYRMPVLAALPTAYFVSGDTGLKQTTEMAWANKFLFAEELAVIVPIPEAVLDDSSFDIWGEIRPKIEEAVGRALDAAIFFGVNKPASWPTDVAASAVAAGNTYTRGTSTAALGGIAEDINQLMGTVEADGFNPNGFVTRTTYKARLRSARDTTGQKLLDVGASSIEGEPLIYAMPGLWPTGSGSAEMFTGDWSQGIIAVRQDFTYKVLDQAVITDNSATPVIQYNLAQQDMVALRVVARYAWQVPNPINYEQLTEASRYPFAVLRAP
jgi:HK97 family phage major capsid protein